MKYLSFIKKNIVVPTFCMASIIMLLILAFMEMLGLTAKPALTLPNALLCLLLAFLISLSNLILLADKLTGVAKVLLHFSATVVSLVIVALCTDYSFGRSSLILIVVYSVAYFIVVPVIFAVKSSAKRKKSDNKPYKSIFSDRA